MSDTPAVPLHFLDDEKPLNMVKDPEDIQIYEPESEKDQFFSRIRREPIGKRDEDGIKHFCSLYKHFLEVIDGENEFFPLTTTDKIKLFGIYSSCW